MMSLTELSRFTYVTPCDILLEFQFCVYPHAKNTCHKIAVSGLLELFKTIFAGKRLNVLCMGGKWIRTT